MRVSLEIPDELHAKLKTLARSEGTTMRAIILREIEKKLAKETLSAPKRLRFPILKSSRPGSLVIDNETIYNIIDFP